MQNLIIRNEMNEKEKEYISERLMEYNLRIAPPNQDYISKNVNLALKGENSKLFGGLIGKIYRECLFIDILWVDENKRGLGYGKKLLIEAEKNAKEDLCIFVHLDTFNFQAPDFYIKNGYEIYGVLDLYSNDIKRFYLKKELY